MATAQLDAPATKPSSDLSVPRPRFYQSLSFWTLGAVTIGIAWRTARFLLQFPIWGDESFVCVNFLDNTFAGLIGPLRVGQICPLTFLWTELALYRWLGPSELAMRLLPYLMGLAALLLFWPLCRRALPPAPAALALSLLAVSYYPVRHAVEVKPYAEDLLAAIGLYLPAALYILNPRNTRWLIFLTCYVPLALVSSYPAVLVAGSLTIVFLPLVWRQARPAVTGWYIAYNVVLGAAFLANYFLVGKPQMTPNEATPNNAFVSTWQEWFPAYDPLSLLIWFLKAHTGNMVAYPIGGPNFLSSLTTLLCLVGGWAWWRAGNRHVLALFVWPFVLSMVAALLHKYPYGGSARVDQHLAPAICLLMGNGIAAVLRRSTRPARGEAPVVLTTALLVAFGAAGLLRDLVKPYKTTAELWNRTFVEQLMARVGPTDRVVLFHPPAGVRPGLEWYFRQHDDRVRWNGTIDWTHFDTVPGKLWCVHIFAHPPVLDPIQTALDEARRHPVQVDYFRSIGPPEHGDDPETAEVVCFEH